MRERKVQKNTERKGTRFGAKELEMAMGWLRDVLAKTCGVYYVWNCHLHRSSCVARLTHVSEDNFGGGR